MGTKTAIVIGAGIVGLASARALSLRGYRVRVLERNPRAVGASVRNFGMVWPVGQPSGVLYERAMRSRGIWQEVLGAGKVWAALTGSLHVARHADEWAVLEEFYEREHPSRSGLRLLGVGEATTYSPAVRKEGLVGCLWSPDELIVNPRQVIAALPELLQEQFGVKFEFGQAVTAVDYPVVWVGGRRIEADVIWVCSGADFETLFPGEYAASGITKCKLQMMRTVRQPDGWRMGASLCAGLTLCHYGAFSGLSSLPALRMRFEREMADYVRWGIHVLVSQTEEGELTIGDTHEYGLDLDPFDRDELNQLVLRYLEGFSNMPTLRIAETWNGTYAKTTTGATEWVRSPMPGVLIVNGLGGAGMTLSFGLAEELARGY